MKITKTQLRQIIKEEIHKQLLSEAQLNEGLGEKALLALMLAMTGMTGAALGIGHAQSQQIEQALNDANPADKEQARKALSKYMSCDNRDRPSGRTVDLAADFIEKNKFGGTAGF